VVVDDAAEEVPAQGRLRHRGIIEGVENQPR
jgi:hypothetical protein